MNRFAKLAGVLAIVAGLLLSTPTAQAQRRARGRGFNPRNYYRSYNPYYRAYRPYYTPYYYGVYPYVYNVYPYAYYSYPGFYYGSPFVYYYYNPWGLYGGIY